MLCWGSNGYGSLGINSEVDTFGVTGLASLGFIAFSHTVPAVMVSVFNHVCALFANGRTQCWGINDAQQLGENLNNINNRGTGAYPIGDGVFVTFSASYNTLQIIQVSAGR